MPFLDLWKFNLSNMPLPDLLGTRIFKKNDLNGVGLYQCGNQIPMPDGRISNNSTSNPTLVPAGVYMKWEFKNNQNYQCPF